MDKNKDKNKEKTPAIDSFPADETPTPTKILRMADMDPFFQDLKENPFDLHFRKATEAVRRGTDILAASLPASSESESLNTPQIYEASSPSVVTSRPVILRSNSHNRIAASGLPVASVQPVAKQFKPIAPLPAGGPAGGDNALLLLKFPGGETVKLSNLPFVKCDSSSSSPPSAQVNQETKLKLKRVLNSNPRLETVTQPPPASVSSISPASGSASDNNKDDLKERNRMSAQRSRVKKRQHIETLLETCSLSQNENQTLRAENKLLLEENDKLRRLLAEHLDCSLTLSRGTRDLLAQELDLVVTPPDTRTHNIQTQTSVTEARVPGRVEFKEFPPPPQTHPEDLRVDTRIKSDLRVDTRIKDDSQTQIKTQSKIVKPERLRAAPQALVAAPVSGGKGKAGASGSVKATLAKHCRKVGTQRSIKASNKGVVARRLKDKLQILKQKLAEDENTLSDIKSGNLK